MKFLDNLFHHNDSQASFSSISGYDEEYHKSCSILGGEFQPLTGQATCIVQDSISDGDYESQEW